MSQKLLRVAVTGGAGQIAYNLLFRIANGEVFGMNQPIALHILEVPQALEALNGVRMELQDCSFPLLEEIIVGSDPSEVLEGVNFVFFVGSKPRGSGMERKELISDNAKIFVQQGRALNKVASKDVVSLVIGNPCNTNCLVLMHNAPDIARAQFHAMSRLDQNRATTQLANYAHVSVKQVKNVTIWGNHSSTLVPDFLNAKISGKEAMEVITDHTWLKGEFITTVQQRGAAIIKARGKSSAASAANAAVDAMKSIIHPELTETHFSTAILSDGNPYGIKDDIVFSFPCRRRGIGKYEIIKDMKWDDFLTEKIKATEKELLEERDMVKDLLN